MHWELWDVESKNLVEDFETEDEALKAVREILAINRPDYIDALALGAMYDEGEPRDQELPPVLRGAELQSRLAESAQEAVDDAARKVHERIRQWLTEEGWAFEEVPAPETHFNFRVSLSGKPRTDIFLGRAHIDHITIGVHVIYGDPTLVDPSQLSDDEQHDLVAQMERDTLMMGLEFGSPGISPIQARFGTYIYFDGLTKDTLAQKILLVHRCFTLSLRTIERGYREAGRSQDDIRRFLRDMSSSDAPLTAAS